MKDLLLKLALLPGFIRHGYDDWKRELWDKDLDSNYCCDGNMCGCGGYSIREVYCNEYSGNVTEREQKSEK